MRTEKTEEAVIECGVWTYQSQQKETAEGKEGSSCWLGRKEGGRYESGYLKGLV